VPYWVRKSSKIAIAPPWARSICTWPAPADDTDEVGFNPFRPRRRTPADYVMVAAALVVCAALVIWALAG
jgi:hypothetical protein